MKRRISLSRLLFAALLFLCLSNSSRTHAQIFSGYSLSTNTTGSLTDMTGATTIMQGGHVQVTSAVIDLPFDFYFRGTRYTQFSVNSGGYIGFSAYPIANNLAGLNTVSTPLFTPFGSDSLALSSSPTHPGQISYKVTGTAPSRVLVIQFANMVANYSSTLASTPNASFEARLYEESGVLEAVYGSMALHSTTTDAAFYIGASQGTSTNTAICINSTDNTVVTTGTYSHTFTPGQAISTLNSGSDGNRKTYTLTPAAAAAPSGLSISTITKTGMSLSWTDNSSNETGFAVYYSTDGGTTYYYHTTTAANTTSLAVTGLMPGSTYHWRVLAIRDGLSAAATQSATTSAASTITSSQSGNWNATTTWVGGVVPTASDNVLIADGHTVTLNTSGIVCNNLTVGGGTSGTLLYHATLAGELTVYGNVLVNSGASFSAGTGSLNTHYLYLGAGSTSLSANSLTVNGSFDMNTTARVYTTFRGKLDAAISGSGSIDFHRFVVAKGNSRTPMLDVQSVITAAAPTSSANGQHLLIESGTFRLSSASSLTAYYGGYEICDTPGRLWLNHASAVLQSVSPGTLGGSNGGPRFQGELRIDAGSFIYGRGDGAATFGPRASWVMNGGSFSIYGFIQFIANAAGSNASFSMTGGNVYIDPQVSTNVVGPTNYLFWLKDKTSFSMSGGNIYFVDPHSAAGGVAWQGGAGLGPYSVTGGSIHFGNGISTTGGGTLSSTSGFGLNSYKRLPNIVINNRTDVAQSRMVRLTDSFYAENVTVTSNGYLYLGSGSNGYSLHVSNTLQNNGTIAGTQPGGTACLGNICFDAADINQSISGSGIWTNIPKLTIENNEDTLVLTNSNLLKVNHLHLVCGTLDPGSKLNIGNASSAGSERPTISLGSSGVLYPPPASTASLSMDETEGLRNCSYLRAASAFSMGAAGEVGTGAMSLSALSVSDTAVTIPANSSVTTSSLTLAANARLYTSGGVLTLGSSASAGTLSYGSGSIIVGKLKRWVMTTASSYDFPVGLASNRRLAQINFSSAPSALGTLTAEWVTGAGGSGGLPVTEGNILVDHSAYEGYWTITAGDGLTGGSYTGTFTPEGLTRVGDYSRLVLLKRANSNSNWTLNGTHVATSGSNATPILQRTGMSGFSDFGVGGDVSTPLPLQFLDFSVKASEQRQSLLNWHNAQEKEIIHYVVERSADAKVFVGIAIVTATNAGAAYKYIDEQPLVGENYYRLRIVGTTGHTYSKTLMLHYQTADQVEVYPNPASSQLRVNFQSSTKIPIQVQVVDALGRSMLQQRSEAAIGRNVLTIDINSLVPGHYFLKLSDMPAVKFEVR